MKGVGSEKQPECVIRGRRLASADVSTAQAVVAEYFARGRWGVAQELAQRWQWCSPNGQVKTRAALAVLVGLEQRGWLRLPPSRRASLREPRTEQEVAGMPKPPERILAGTVGDYRPLRWERVVSETQRAQWRQVLAAYHYLGTLKLVGANLKYLVWSRQGELLAALGWQSAVERLGCRDRLVGWNAVQRARWLDHVVNNVRFLVLPWVAVPHLASAILSEGLAVLQRDWRQQYGTAVWLAESFIDRQRFSGACYRAANWQALGWTCGYAKRQSQFVYHGQPKEVYVYVLEPRLRRLVTGDATQPLLTREFLLAQRQTEEPQLSARRKRMSKAKETWTPKLPPHWDLSVADVECVRQEFNEFTQAFRDTFRRIEPRELFDLYLQGLLSDTEHKNMEAMALELVGPEAVRNLQRFVGQYGWDEPEVRRRHWEQAAALLADEQGVWCIDASEFAKKGRDSVGVAPQYCGALGKVANCQSGVFVCYSSPKGHALLDDRLYLPQCWFDKDYAERRQQCRIPREVTFQTKPELALGLLQGLWASGKFPGRWVTCDCSFGNHEQFLEALPADSLYLADIACTRKVWVKSAPEHPRWETQGGTVAKLVATKGLLNWDNRKVTEGEKGPIVAAFARLRVFVSAERTPETERTLLLRNDPNGQIKYALSNAPEDTSMSELVRISGARWPVERCFNEDKGELGLDHYEHRSWPAWHRHMRLVFLAQLFLLRLRQKYKKSPSPDLAAGPAVIRMELAASAG